MSQHEILGVNVEFPFAKPYPSQLEYMTRVIEALQTRQYALLESPTGTGKTVCLLCATLAWRQHVQARQELGFAKMANGGWTAAQRAEDERLRRVTGAGDGVGGETADEVHDPTRGMDLSLEGVLGGGVRVPPIVYAARTHTQLSQVVDELKRTVYRPKMSLVGSRDQLCIHPEVTQMSGQGRDYACRVKVQSNSCAYKYNVGDAHTLPDFDGAVLDIEDLKAVGQKNSVCPFYYEREQLKTADIVFLPYNYLVDPTYRKTLAELQLSDAVVIFDEAHNLEQNMSDSASFNLTSIELAKCIREVQSAIDLALQAGLGTDSAEVRDFALLKNVLLELERHIDSIPLQGNPPAQTYSGQQIYRLLGQVNLTKDSSPLLMTVVEQVRERLQSAIAQMDASKNPELALDKFLALLRIVFRPENSEQSTSRDYRMHVFYDKATERTGKSYKQGASMHRVIGFWCFNPGVAMRGITDLNIRNLILTSGTLTPLESFAQELGVPFPVRLENPHVITKEQIWVGVLAAGPTGQALNSSFKNRSSPAYMTELGGALANICRICPDGVLVFFPAYGVMNATIDHWKTDGTWARIERHKFPVVEPRESARCPAAMDEFYARLDDESLSGAVFFAVCRGKVSEGLDFADRRGRAVVITGIPYPAFMDPKVRLKREYMTERSRDGASVALTGDAWYSQQATRAVNQAVGRVIRHRLDHGAIIFADSRFAQQQISSGLSKWLRPHLTSYQQFGQAMTSLTRFFKDIDKMPFAVERVVQLKAARKERAEAAERMGLAPANSSYQIVRPRVQIAMERESAAMARAQRLGKEQQAEAKAAHHRANPGKVDASFSQGLYQGGLASGAPAPAHAHSLFSALSGSSARDGAAPNRLQPVLRKSVSLSEQVSMRRLLSEQGGAAEPGRKPTLQERRAKQAQVAAENKRLQGAPAAAAPAPVSASPFAQQGGRAAQMLTSAPATPAPAPAPTPTPAPASRPPVQETGKPLEPQEYLRRAKELLTGEEYTTFKAILRKFKMRELRLPDVVEQLRDLFAGPKRRMLLVRFGDFVPQKLRPAYHSMLSAKKPDEAVPVQRKMTLGTKGDESSDPFAGGLPPKRRKSDVGTMSGTVPLTARSRPADVTASAPVAPSKPVPSKPVAPHVPSAAAVQGSTDNDCPICKGPLAVPFRSKCNHVCCYLCWTKWLEHRLECPLCRERVRLKQLSKVAFL